jgi:twitching motility protein PilT
MELTIDKILERAGREKASDIIISSGMPPVLIINGRIHRLGDFLMSPEETRKLVYSLLERFQIARFETERELDFSISLNGNMRFRGNAFWQKNSVGTVLRLVPTEIPAISNLGLPPIVTELAAANQGLVLVTGPTGHGKSTTQAAMIDHINKTRSCHIITIEDPIEFLHTGIKSVIQQREVGTDTLSFAAALRHALRQAPHVILVGELRDTETIGTALTAAETGHLVLATLHTNDAPQSIDRIIDVFPPNQQNQIRAQLSSCLLAVISQRLLPHALEKRRILACEILRANPAVSNLIRENKVAHIYGVMETQAKAGMVAMDKALKQLYMEGQISEEVAKTHMKHPQTLFGA